MKIQQKKKFAIVSFSEEKVHGILFRSSKDSLELLSAISENIEPSDTSAAWKTVLKAMGKGKECPLYLTGSLPEGICFDTLMADIQPKFMRLAIEMELPRHLLKVPENVRFQFAPADVSVEDQTAIRVYAAPAHSFEPLAALLTQCSSKADEFIYPALALRKNDPPFAAPELENGMMFANGTWNHSDTSCTPYNRWEEHLQKELKLHFAEKITFQDSLLHILAARLVLNRNRCGGLDFLPETLRPKRLRTQIHITIILAILLFLNILWSCAGDWKGSFSSMRSLQQEIQELQQENATLKRQIKQREKSQKELLRLLNLNTGERELLGKFADLSAVIPLDVLVLSLRWNESGVELQMQSSSEEINLAGAIRKLPYWKISQLQQRNWGDNSSSMITLKLIPAEGQK